tara:strand:- start:1022 stop:1366 length:345 start_codon:yes stop_codon:yes gene_type:complete
MAAIEPTNIQLTLQMGSHTEKLQQTIQQQPMVISQQLEEEHFKVVELKNEEVQNSENTQLEDDSNLEGKMKNQPFNSRTKINSISPVGDDQRFPVQSSILFPEINGGRKINVVA